MAAPEWRAPNRETSPPFSHQTSADQPSHGKPYWARLMNGQVAM